jgi:DNA (cytosine-5)-methyltransferase 1
MIVAHDELTQTDSLSAIDLFCGAGGTGVGFIDAGYNILGALDNDANAAQTYSNNLGIKVLEEDIREVDPNWLRNQLGLGVGKLGVLAGCPPCQGFSRIRNKHGASDERNSLVLRYSSFVEEFKPKFALFENVPGLTRSTHGKRYYQQLLSALRALNYNPREFLLDAADFGVPQRRRRVIVVAGRDNVMPPPIVPTHGHPSSVEVLRGGRKPWVTVREAIRHYPPLQAGEKSASIPNHVAARTGMSVRGKRVLEFIKRIPKDGGSRHDLPRNEWLKCHKHVNGFKDVYGRLGWDVPSNTMTGGCTNPSKGRFVHPTQHRALTPREAATLQSFPDSFVFYGARIAQQIGNAVPPMLARAVADALAPLLASNEWPPVNVDPDTPLDLFESRSISEHSRA